MRVLLDKRFVENGICVSGDELKQIGLDVQNNYTVTLISSISILCCFLLMFGIGIKILQNAQKKRLDHDDFYKTSIPINYIV